MTINIAELRESIAAFGSPAINEDDLNELFTRLESEEEANREWDKKTYWVQEEVQKGDLPLNYLGWHRADIIRAEVFALRAQVAGLKSSLEEVEKERDELRESEKWYRRRCDLLQEQQSKMRDPERTIVCDILANGGLLHQTVAGNRYALPGAQEDGND